MSHVPLGKVLLRNVIRHTDAHNKIQEESEMWKIREMEKQSKDIHWGKQQRMLPKSSSRMRSDGFDEETHWKTRNLASLSATMEEDDLRHARYWNKKLYECEANMPDRWGHSGYRELYPEEFDTDSNGERDEQNSMNGKRKRQLSKQSSLELPPRKKTKKSHKKKQKKKSHKKRKKKKKREQPSAMQDSSQESEHSEADAATRKRSRHKKAKKASTRAPGSSSGQENDSSEASSCPSSSSEDSELEEKQEKQRKKKKRRKHHSSVSERGGERVQEKRSKRKNWKVAADENSEDSSDED
ncbi:uncharacterized protein NKAPD1 isoform X2 [Sceloporus undulatus]|uniref:uncharacterized protein NKAPD1 isoform X2 n=1 Tax=Sceloporus undulatus TaxID=8520 RepID=UPI001C4CDDF7|nr:uncharacterized protein NKAPD1 isoform X2 [Sceloporus undulatus]